MCQLLEVIVQGLGCIDVCADMCIDVCINMGHGHPWVMRHKPIREPIAEAY